MGFEDNNDALGFEDEQLDLDGNQDLSMGTGRTRAQRKKGIKTEEVAFASPKRDRFGRRGDGEEAGVGADMLNPDKPTRIAGGFSRREMTRQEVKPLQSENSKFSYLFSDDEEDEDEVSTVEGKRSAVDALAMKGDEADAGNVFQRETRSVIHSQGKPQRRSEPEPQSEQRASGTSRFSRRSEQPQQTEKPAAPRFARRSAAKEAPAEPVKEETVKEQVPEVTPAPVQETVPPVQDTVLPEPAAEEIYTEQPEGEQVLDGTVYADSQMYGYGNPYAPAPYGQYPPYNPYGGYPPQNPYMQPYGQQPYPYQYPANYAQPQYIPVGYVFQAGFVPVDMAHGAPRRRKRPSAARAAYRYDQAPEEQYEEQPRRGTPRVRAISAAPENTQEAPAAEPAAAVISEPAVTEEPKPVFESQYDRIASEIPEMPVAAEPAAPAPAEEKTAAPSRFARRGSSSESAAISAPVSDGAPAAANTTPSRFSSRGSAASRAPQSPAAEAPAAPADSSASTGGRFKRRS